MNAHTDGTFETHNYADNMTEEEIKRLMDFFRFEIPDNKAAQGPSVFAGQNLSGIDVDNTNRLVDFFRFEIPDNNAAQEPSVFAGQSLSDIDVDNINIYETDDDD
jgi:hypothetical protein